MQLIRSTSLQGCPQFCPHIAPKCRIRLFVDTGNRKLHRLPDNMPDQVCCVFLGNMPGFRIHHQDLDVRIHLPQIIMGIQHHPGAGPGCHELDAGIQGTGEIICQDQ